MRRSVTDIDLIVARNMRHIRNVAGMSQEELGEKLGITFQQVQKYEKGANRISAGRLVQSARALGCSLANLFEGIDPGTERKATAYSPDVLAAAALIERLSQRQRTAVFGLMNSMAEGWDNG